MDRKAFCGGIGCHAQDRKFKCVDCGKSVCSTCTVKEAHNTYCINCFIISFPKALNQALENTNKKLRPHKTIKEQLIEHEYPFQDREFYGFNVVNDDNQKNFV